MRLQIGLLRQRRNWFKTDQWQERVDEHAYDKKRQHYRDNRREQDAYVRKILTAPPARIREDRFVLIQKLFVFHYHSRYTQRSASQNAYTGLANITSSANFALAQAPVF